MRDEDRSPPASPASDEAASRRRGWGFRLAAALGLPLLLFLLLEGGLRLAGYDHPPGGPFLRFVNPDLLVAEQRADGPTVPDDALFWRMRPGWKYWDGQYTMNSRGFRSPEFTDRKLPGTMRVIVIGDSSAYGLRVGPQESWSGRLQHALRNRLGTEAVEVLNLATPGYTSHQGLVLYRSDVSPLSPDVVVAAFGSFNDWVPAVGRADALQGTRPGWHGLRVIQLAFALLAPAPEDEVVTDFAEAERRVRELDTRGLERPRRVPPDDFERNLIALTRAVHADGAKLVLVAQPLPGATRQRNPVAADYAEITRTVATQHADGFVDGWTAFLAMDDIEDLFADFCHPNVEGHARLAPLVVDAVEPLLREE